MSSLINSIPGLSSGKTTEVQEDISKDVKSKTPESQARPSSTTTPLQESHHNYSTYQSSLYALCLHGKKPQFSTQPSQWPLLAQKAMTPEAWCYLEGGSGTSSTMNANTAAFRKYKLIPKMLTGNNTRSLRTKLFGMEFPSPIIMAPVGINRIFHPDAESGVAAACARVGIPYTISTAASTSIEDIALAGDSAAGAATDSAGTSAEEPDEKKTANRFFQLYWPRKQDDDVTLSLLSRAWAVGCRVLIVTVDTWALGWRPQDLDHSYIPFFLGTGCQIGFSDPVWTAKYTTSTQKSISEDPTSAALSWLRVAFSGTNRTWSDLSFLRSHWQGTLVIKGLQTAHDALAAIDAGCDGIIVSNHGGRQYDGAVGSLSMLPEIAEAVRTKKTARGEQVTVLFDSGIRCGADIMKALALGAHGVFVGRPVMYGLGMGGEAGAEHVLRSLLADLDLNLGVMGFSGVGEVSARDLKVEPWA